MTRCRRCEELRMEVLKLMQDNSTLRNQLAQKNFETATPLADELFPRGGFWSVSPTGGFEWSPTATDRVHALRRWGGLPVSEVEGRVLAESQLANDPAALKFFRKHPPSQLIRTVSSDPPDGQKAGKGSK